jgi:hypothetical protein
MPFRKILIIFSIILFVPTLIQAQFGPGGDLTVTTNPQGAEVILEGDVILSGVSPVRFRQMIVGKYNLIVKKAGYETYCKQISVDPFTPTEIDVRLKSKTKSKALTRSLLIPGWGQRYGDRKAKGNIFTILTIGAAATFAYAELDYQDKKDEFELKQTEYDEIISNGTIEELNDFYPGFVISRDDAYDAETFRRASFVTLAGVYAINLIDILFFFPDDRDAISIKGLSVSPQISPDTHGMKLSVKF